MVMTDLDIALRLVIITALSGLIGLEREYHGKPAGLRTNIMVGLGSTLMTIAGVKALDLFGGVASNIDPTRIAGQIITGIGFIGAGAILRPSDNKNQSVVIGLTTAATLWVVSGLGIAVGMGMFLEAIITTALVFFTFLLLGRMVNYIREHARIYNPHHTQHDDPEEVPRGHHENQQ